MTCVDYRDLAKRFDMFAALGLIAMIRHLRECPTCLEWCKRIPDSPENTELVKTLDELINRVEQK